jgi:hypothetical protein
VQVAITGDLFLFQWTIDVALLVQSNDELNHDPMIHKKNWLEIIPSQLNRSTSYVNLVAIVVMMMTVVAVNSMSVVPVVPRSRVIAIVWICSIVSVRVIIAVRIAVIAIPVSRIPKPDSDAPNSD